MSKEELLKKARSMVGKSVFTIYGTSARVIEVQDNDKVLLEDREGFIEYELADFVSEFVQS